MIKNTLFQLTLATATSLSLSAATTFVNTLADGDLNNAGNWDNGLPGAANVGTTTADGNLTADLSNASEDLIVHSNITTGANTLNIGGSGDDLLIGETSNGSVTVNAGGKLNAIGAGVDVRLGRNGGIGNLTFEAGSSIDTRKIIDVYNGTLKFGSSVSTFQNGLQTNLRIRAAGNLVYDVDAALANHTLNGNSLDVILDAGSSLALNFASGAANGSQFTLVDEVTSFSGTFTNISATGLSAGQSIELTYDTTVTDQGFLRATVVPEPSSTALIGLGGLALLLRRRK